MSEGISGISFLGQTEHEVREEEEEEEKLEKEDKLGEEKKKKKRRRTRRGGKGGEEEKKKKIVFGPIFCRPTFSFRGKYAITNFELMN